MDFAPYQTFNGLLIHVEKDGEDPDVVFTVYVTGDRQKELLRTPDEAAAVKYAEGLKAHYEERKVAEA